MDQATPTSARARAVLCDDHARSAPDVQAVSAGTLRLFARIAPEDFGAQDSHAAVPAVDEFNAAIQGFVSYVLERELKTVKYL